MSFKNLNAFNDLLAEKREIEKNYSISLQEAFRRLLRSLFAGAWLKIELNGIELLMPRDALRTMYHCISFQGDHGLKLRVETAHIEWMKQHLTNGATFIDCGSSTGAATLPLGKYFCGKLRILAYEPARTAKRLLLETLKKNKIKNVLVRPFALSSSKRKKIFREYHFDPTDAVPWMPEASCLDFCGESNFPNQRDYLVKLTTLDMDALPRCKRGPVVIKIDVEGHEMHVLQGAVKLIKDKNPWFSIDIHTDPEAKEKTTEEKIKEFLMQYKYTFQKFGHVLLCSPDKKNNCVLK